MLMPWTEAWGKDSILEDTRLKRREEVGLEEGVDDFEGADLAAVLEILRVKDGRAGFDGGGDDE